MAHIHLPDGILPPWLWGSGWMVVLIFFMLSGRVLRDEVLAKKVPLVAMVSAVMLIAMSLEIVPIAYHMTLAVAAGIILGPFWVVVASFTINLILSFFGHGGITVVGLNTLVVGTEGILGYIFFRLFGCFHRKVALAAFFSALFSLICAALLAIGIVTLGMRDSRGILNIHEKVEVKVEHELSEEQVQSEQVEHKDMFNLRRFTVTTLALGSVGWILEAFVTTVIIVYLSRTKSPLLDV